MMSTQTGQKSEIASAVEEAFTDKKASVEEARANNRTALNALEEGLFEVSKQVAANSEGCLDIYRYGGVKTSNHQSHDGSYHMTQTYVLAFSKKRGWGYDHVLFIRHSCGHLNNVNFKKVDNRQELGHPYQSISVFDYVDYEPDKSGLRFGYPELKDVLKRLAGDKVEIGNVFNGQLNNPQQAIRTVVVTLGKYYAELMQPDAKMSDLNIHIDLDDRVADVMLEHSGLLAGRSGMTFPPELVRIRPKTAQVLKILLDRVFGS
ncbi:MAG: hypothetical protein MRY79_03240 [Alphaproteobacteria bacterium]|nr:hypothetical protein [Alphaproteobacteria bacterium]